MQNFIHQSNQLANNKNFNSDSQVLNSNHLIYRTFTTKSIDSFLGISVQKQRLYVIQKKCICVFQYFIGFQNTCTQKAPILIKEILLPFQISKYIITQKYICVKSKNKTQIRDNQFEKVFYSQNNGIITTRPKPQNQQTFNSNDFNYDTAQQLELQCQIINDDMVSWKVIMKRKANDSRYLREYWSERYNILTKQKSIIKCRSEMIDPSNKNRKIQICKSPVFVNQLGYIQNFYIWPITSNDIQIGIYYNYKEYENVVENHLYEICSFQLKQTNIKNIFHYNFKSNAASSKNKDGPHLFLAVCENSQNSKDKEKSTIKIVIFQILPQQNMNNDDTLNEKFNSYFQQFNQLRKQNKSQQSLSNSNLLNELLNNESKSQGSNPNQPTVIIESFILKNSTSLKKLFFNPMTNVLWINDSSEVVYKIKFIQSGDLKMIKQKGLSFIQTLQGVKNGQNKPDLQGIMYDNYPIFKVNAFNLQIGCKPLKQKDFYEVGNLGQNLNMPDIEDKSGEDDKQVIEFDDNQLQKIDKQNQIKKQITSKSVQLKPQPKKVHEIQSQTQNQLVQPQTQKQQIPIPILEKIHIETQTQNIQQVNQPLQESQKHIQINNLSQLLKQLNFNKVQEVLMRFSQIFSGLVTKNVNKLKDYNQKAKQQIKLKINSDIFQLINEVFSCILNDAMSDKIQKQMLKARQFVQKIFNKHIQHFNLMLIDQKAKQQNIKKSILQQQLRSIDIIKQASFKFLDVTKIRQMQKIAYNQVVVQSIKQVSKKIQNLNLRLDEFTKQSAQIEKKIISQVKEIKQTFKLLIQLQENESKEDESSQVDSQKCSESGFQSEQDNEQETISYDMKEREGLKYKRIPPVHEAQSIHNYPFMNPHQIPSYNDRISGGWNSYNQGPTHPPYPYLNQHPTQHPPPQMNNYSGQPFYQNPPHYPPVYPTYSHPNNQYSNILPAYQQSFVPHPPPNTFHPSYSQIRKGSQKLQNQGIKQKKKKAKSSVKGSLLVRNE